MGWSLSFHGPSEPQLVDATLLAAGRALHLANMFESKYYFVLQIARLDSYFKNNPKACLTDGVDAVAALSRRKVLGPAITDLTGFPDVNPEQAAALDSARVGRNFIAHEGAAFGHVWSAGRASIVGHLAKLRKAVENLAEGDNVVSGWVYEIEEKEPAPRHFPAIYPTLVDQWVFEHIDAYLQAEPG
jgi:hypothetical protein